MDKPLFSFVRLLTNTRNEFYPLARKGAQRAMRSSGELKRRDPLSPEERSQRMSLVRMKDTKPELAVRHMVSSLGYRYRLHSRILPGTPDLVFPGRRKVIFVHGCFWHRHTGCVLARLPKSRPEFWVPKLEGNKQRDQRNKRALAKEGWKVLTIWECQVKDTARLQSTIRRFLDAQC
jgi:DNA mismatch endonuclease, patch repair protein